LERSCHLEQVYLIALLEAKLFFASKGFSTPTVAETLTPAGKINTDLQPEIGWNYEWVGKHARFK
jgi:hypothetical protein